MREFLLADVEQESALSLGQLEEALAILDREEAELKRRKVARWDSLLTIILFLLCILPGAYWLALWRSLPLDYRG